MLKQKPDQAAGPCGKTRRSCGGLLLPFPLGPVNPSALRFRVLPLAGLALAGGWAERLVLWLPMADQAARLLRDAIGGRI